MSEDAAARAARRRNWPGARYTVGDQPSDDLSAVTTAEERLDMMWPLACDAWACAQRPFPTYTRSEIPGRLYRSLHERDAKSE
jgi:hypothetical protein